MSTPAKTVAKTVKAKTKKAATKTATTIKLTNDTTITFKSPRPEGMLGPKTKLLALVPRKGTISYKALKEKAIEEGLNAELIAQYLSVMAKNGRVTLE